MKENQVIELLKTSRYPNTLAQFLSVSNSLKKLILDRVDLNQARIFDVLLNQKTINILTLMNLDVNTDVLEAFYQMIVSSNITRYAFINVMFEKLTMMDIFNFLDRLVFSNSIVDTLIFHECEYSADFLKVLLYCVAVTKAPLQALELTLTGDATEQFARMISMTNTLSFLSVNAKGFQINADSDMAILNAFKKNVTIETFEFPEDDFFYADTTKGLIQESIEYNENHKEMFDVFRMSRPQLHGISERKLLERYLEEEKELKEKKIRPYRLAFELV